MGDLSDNSVENCIDACHEAGYQFAGVQNANQCFCGDSKPDASLSRPGECNDICPGNSNENCGGSWRMNIYSTGKLVKLESIPVLLYYGPYIFLVAKVSGTIHEVITSCGIEQKYAIKMLSFGAPWRKYII